MIPQRLVTRNGIQSTVSSFSFPAHTYPPRALLQPGLALYSPSVSARSPAQAQGTPAAEPTGGTCPSGPVAGTGRPPPRSFLPLPLPRRLLSSPRACSPGCAAAPPVPCDSPAGPASRAGTCPPRGSWQPGSRRHPDTRRVFPPAPKRAPLPAAGDFRTRDYRVRLGPEIITRLARTPPPPPPPPPPPCTSNQPGAILVSSFSPFVSPILEDIRRN